MNGEQKFWVLIWLEIGLCIALVLVTAITVGCMYSGNVQKLKTIQQENIIKNCALVDVHIDEYGGVDSYVCKPVKDAK